MQKILSNELDRIEDEAWKILGVNRTYEEKEKLQAKVSKVIFELSQEGAIVAGRTEISTIAFLGIGLCPYPYA